MRRRSKSAFNIKLAFIFFLTVKMILFLLCVFALPRLPSASAARNDKPIVGVLAQEVNFPKPNQTAYVAASYVKFLESGGARVVPIMINQPFQEYQKLFNSINGVLFPGGAVSIKSSGYQKAARIFYDLALEANRRGDYFPVWGTCLGFQQLALLTSRNALLTSTNTSGVPLPLTFTNETKESRMFKNFPAALMRALASEPLSVHSHHWSLAVETFNTNEELKKFYKVISLNTDGKTEFVSTMEGRDFPVYATQWHPEKTTYEWTRPFIVHSPAAVKTSFYMAQFFVNEARKNFHKFGTVEEERKALIYNYKPVYTGLETGFEQTYFF